MGSRYTKSSGENLFAGLVEIASVIPWWITLPIALLLFYFVPYGPAVETELKESADLAGVVLGLFIKMFFKYLVPAALITGTFINIFSSLKSFFLFREIEKKGVRETIEKLSWEDFEFLLSEWFKKEGFNTELTGGSADGGVDIKLYKDNKLYLVQCKHYKAWKVSVNVVRELFGVISAEKAEGGYIVTSGHFTKDAYIFAKGKNIELIDGKKLEAVLNEISSQTHVSKNKVCPECGAVLVEREGKYGKFFGCSTYPKCKFTKPVD